MSEIGDKVMRAKLQVTSITRVEGGERIKMSAVAMDTSYPADGRDEDNTFAMFSPSAEFELYCCNPDLMGKINPGERFYVDFTRAPNRKDYQG